MSAHQGRRSRKIKPKRHPVTSNGSMGCVLSEHSDADIHHDMEEPLRREKERSLIKEQSDRGSDSESETEDDIDVKGNDNQNGCAQVVDSKDDAVGDHQDAQDVEVFVRAKLLPVEVHGKQLLKIISVFQVAPLFQIDGIIRSSYMQHVTPLLQNLQFGLYKRGPFTPLPFNKLQQYGLVMMTGESSNILVSNEVESNKLYLKIKPAEERVIVARNYNNKSYFTLMQGQGPFANQYALKSNSLADRALKYDATIKEVVLSPYDSSDSSFYFLFPPIPRKDQQYLFVH